MTDLRRAHIRERIHRIYEALQFFNKNEKLEKSLNKLTTD